MANLIGTADAIAYWSGFSDLGTTTQSALIGAASAWVETYCRRTFTAGTYTEYHDGNGLPRLWLRQRPVLTVGTVTVNDSALDNSTSDAWQFNPDTGELIRGVGHVMIRHGQTWPHGFRNIVVTYTAGYSTIPDQVKAATASMVKHLNDAVPKTGLFSSENLGGYSYVLNTAFSKGGPPPLVGQLLAAYRTDEVF